MHLIDQARAHVEKTYARPMMDRLLRSVLAFIMPRPALFRLSLIAARLAKPLAGLLEKRIAAMLELVPRHLPRPETFGAPGLYPAAAQKKGRVALLKGCVESVLDPAINAATIRLLTRLGYEVVVTEGESCCGSITLHMGRKQDALARARRSIDQWTAAKVDHVIITASGCGTTIKDYGHLLRLDPAYAEKAKAISTKALDITEFLARLELTPAKKNLRVAYHSACSMQHGQKIHAEPRDLLKKVGFTVLEVPEGHLCCGSAGTYNILQPQIAAQLKLRKVRNIASTAPQLVATGNIGCIAQLQDAISVPIVHTVELLDWATGGPRPKTIPEALDEQKT
jgi:glycolate oxidase iron-sulfur subunit